MQLSAVVPSVHLLLAFSNTNVQELVLDAICTSVSGFTSYLQNTKPINTSRPHMVDVVMFILPYFPLRWHCLHLVWHKIQHVIMRITTRMINGMARMPITMAIVRSSKSSRDGADVSVIPHSGSRKELTTGWQDPSTTKICSSMRS